ncbi:MAG: YkgJ family cysteine cluster protein [Erysipelotrichia bacterium]|nr:YkgJ family cysteine cluster protein [Erysipelotrichia bacterium]
MISLYHKVQKVESLQKSVDKDTKVFKRHACIECESFCAECCRYNDVTATSLEFLPFAWHAYKLGLLEQWLEDLEKNESQQCIFLRQDADKWGCKIYPVRGLICRLFGFSAITDKNGRPVYAACRILKQHRPETASRAGLYVVGGGKVPVISTYYRRLASIDPSTGNDFMPINQAIKKALEIVYFHCLYRESA